tara:strand:+ start:338 stop:586 length:249 start_codon:yes stop_codon:yes gene_type:complete
MEDNSFLIDDNVIVNKSRNGIPNRVQFTGKIVKISEGVLKGLKQANGRVDTGETVYLIKDSDDGMYFWADNEDLTLDKEEHE